MRPVEGDGGEPERRRRGRGRLADAPLRFASRLAFLPLPLLRRAPPGRPVPAPVLPHTTPAVALEDAGDVLVVDVKAEAKEEVEPLLEHVEGGRELDGWITPHVTDGILYSGGVAAAGLEESDARRRGRPSPVAAAARGSLLRRAARARRGSMAAAAERLERRVAWGFGGALVTGWIRGCAIGGAHRRGARGRRRETRTVFSLSGGTRG